MHERGMQESREEKVMLQGNQGNHFFLSVFLLLRGVFKSAVDGNECVSSYGETFLLFFPLLFFCVKV
jgi:hypothetical protein